MRYLVAGGTGHTGERLVRRLCRKGHEVRVLTRRNEEDEILDGLVEWGAIPVHGDCTRRWTLWEALEGCDVLVSCAHIRYAEANVQACQQVGVRRYLQMSSTRRFTKFPCTSSREVIAGEEAILESGLDWTIIRPTMIFGGRRDQNLTKMIAWFRKHSWFPIFGIGRNLVQPVFVEDLLDAMEAALENPEKSNHRAFTIAGPEPIIYRRFLREIARATGRKLPVFPTIPLHAAITASRLLPSFIANRTLSHEQIRRFAEHKDADISEAREILGYNPRPFVETIRQKANGDAEVERLYSRVGSKMSDSADTSGAASGSPGTPEPPSEGPKGPGRDQTLLAPGEARGETDET